MFLPVMAFFCTVAFSYTLADTVQDGTLQSGDASWRDVGNVSANVYYCKVVNNTNYITKYGDEKVVLKKIERDPDKYILGKCEDVPSPA